MALYWLVFEHDGKNEEFLQHGGHLISARLQAQVKGQQGEFIEGHALDPKMVKQVPAKLIGRSLHAKEAEELLKKIG
jgi:hypothetical protein